MDLEQVILRVPPSMVSRFRSFARGEAELNVSVEPGDGADRYIVRVGSESYNASLVNMPCIIEAMKTNDHAIYHKAGDITRMLVVEDPQVATQAGQSARAGAASGRQGSKGLKEDGGLDLALVPDPTPGSNLQLLDSGLTPPMRHIVRRKFAHTWQFITKYAADEVAEAERVLVELTGRDKPVYEHVVEELVDAEDFMAAWFDPQAAEAPPGLLGDAAGDNVTILYEDGTVVDMYQVKKDGRVARPHPDGTFPQDMAYAGKLSGAADKAARDRAMRGRLEAEKLRAAAAKARAEAEAAAAAKAAEAAAAEAAAAAKREAEALMYEPSLTVADLMALAGGAADAGDASMAGAGGEFGGGYDPYAFDTGAGAGAGGVDGMMDMGGSAGGDAAAMDYMLRSLGANPDALGAYASAEDLIQAAAAAAFNNLGDLVGAGGGEGGGEGEGSGAGAGAGAGGEGGEGMEAGGAGMDGQQQQQQQQLEAEGDGDTEMVGGSGGAAAAAPAVPDSPEVQRLRADLARLLEERAKAQADYDSNKQRYDAATIAKMKERWQTQMAKAQGQLEALAPQIAAVQDQLTEHGVAI